MVCWEKSKDRQHRKKREGFWGSGKIVKSQFKRKVQEKSTAFNSENGTAIFPPVLKPIITCQKRGGGIVGGKKVCFLK